MNLEESLYLDSKRTITYSSFLRSTNMMINGIIECCSCMVVPGNSQTDGRVFTSF